MGRNQIRLEYIDASGFYIYRGPEIESLLVEFERKCGLKNHSKSAQFLVTDFCSIVQSVSYRCPYHISPISLEIDDRKKLMDFFCLKIKKIWNWFGRSAYIVNDFRNSKIRLLLTFKCFSLPKIQTGIDGWTFKISAMNFEKTPAFIYYYIFSFPFSFSTSHAFILSFAHIVVCNQSTRTETKLYISISPKKHTRWVYSNSSIPWQWQWHCVQHTK